MRTKITIIAAMLIYSLQSFSQAPDWEWVKRVGGNGNVYATAVTSDASGNFYIAGYFASPTITFASTTLTSVGSYDIFIVKFDVDSNFLWAKSAGGTQNDGAISIKVDKYGAIYVAGFFGSHTIAFGSTTLTNADTTGTYSADLFLVKYDSSGNTLWAKSAGGNFNDDDPTSVSIDDLGNVLITGSFSSTSITFGGINLNNALAGLSDMFIAKYDSGGDVLWAKSAGNYSVDYANSVTVDHSGNIYVVGSFESPSITFGGTTLINANNTGSNDIFIAKYDMNGSVIWAKGIGGTADEFASSVCLDSSDNIYVLGSFSSPLLIFGIDTLSTVGEGDILLMKCDPNGTVLWAQSSGGIYYDFGYSVASNAHNSVYVTGYFRSPTITFGTTTLSNYFDDGLEDIFIAKYDSIGNILWAKSVGGNNDDVATSIALDPLDNVYIAGQFRSPSLSFGSSIITNVDSNSIDIFFAKLSGKECSANFILYPDSLIPHHYWALNIAAGVAPLTYLWSWGDGAYDSIAYPSHTYAAAGFYTICLTIHDSTGCFDSTCISYNIQKMSSAEAENTIVKVDVVDSIPSIPTNIQNTTVLQSWSVFPNPTSGNSFINYTLSTPATVNISLYDVLGNKLQQLVNGNQEQGEHNATIDAHNLANGIYVLQIRAGDEMAEEKMVIMN